MRIAAGYFQVSLTRKRQRRRRRGRRIRALLRRTVLTCLRPATISATEVAVERAVSLQAEEDQCPASSVGPEPARAEDDDLSAGLRSETRHGTREVPQRVEAVDQTAPPAETPVGTAVALEAAEQQTVAAVTPGENRTAGNLHNPYVLAGRESEGGVVLAYGGTATDASGRLTLSYGIARLNADGTYDRVAGEGKVIRPARKRPEVRVAAPDQAVAIEEAVWARCSACWECRRLPVKDNDRRRHSALGYRAPAVYAAARTHP